MLQLSKKMHFFSWLIVLVGKHSSLPKHNIIRIYLITDQESLSYEKFFDDFQSYGINHLSFFFGTIHTKVSSPMISRINNKCLSWQDTNLAFNKVPLQSLTFPARFRSRENVEKCREMSGKVGKCRDMSGYKSGNVGEACVWRTFNTTCFMAYTNIIKEKILIWCALQIV